MRSSMKCALLAGGLVLLLSAGACNKSTQDPGSSSNLLTVSSVSPSTACIDGDGATTDAGTVWSSVSVRPTFTSYVRGGSPSPWDTVYLTTVDVVFDPSNGMPAATRSISATIPGNGTATPSVLLLYAQDVATYFDLATNPPTTGAVHLVFHGHDAANNSVTVTTDVPYTVANACTVQ